VSLLQGSYTDCVAPSQPFWNPSTATKNLTVLVQVLVLTPLVGDDTAGIGPPSIQVMEGMAVTTLDISSVYPVTLLNSSAGTNATGHSRLRRAAVAGNWRSAVYGSKLMYTYVPSGQTCGCDIAVSTECDSCGAFMCGRPF
jgi:hypothetical protein